MNGIKEKIAVVILILVMGGAGFYLFVGPESFSNKEEAQAHLGVVIRVVGEAKRRSPGTPGFLPLQKGSVLKEGDTVYTFDESFVTVQMSKGSLINITPNTVIELKDKENDLILGLGRGFLGLNLQSLAEKLILKIGKKELGVSSKNAKLHVAMETDDKGELTLVDGGAKVTMGEKKIALNRGQKIDLDKKEMTLEVSTYGIDPKSPNIEKVFYEGQDKRIDLRWESKDAVDDYKLTTARDPQFRKVVDARETKTKSASIQIKGEGHYFWKVEGRKKGSVTSKGPISTFRIKKSGPPHLLYPSDGGILQMAGDKESTSVSLRWEDSESSGYEVEFFRFGVDKDKGEILKSGVATLAVADLAPNEYKWRVRALPEQGKKPGRWSVYRYFSLEFDESVPGAAGKRRRREYFDENDGKWIKK